MINIGKKMHCPSACTAGTLSANIASTSPSPMNAKDTTVNATQRSNGCAGSGMPKIKASPSCKAPALKIIT